MTIPLVSLVDLQPPNVDNSLIVIDPVHFRNLVLAQSFLDLPPEISKKDKARRRAAGKRAKAQRKVNRGYPDQRH